MSIKLTKKIVSNLTYDGGWDVRWDSELSGFGIRLYPTGKKSFVLSYRVNGRKRLLVLGNYGILTPDEARNIAKLKLTEVLKGKDPAEEKKKGIKGTNFKTFCSIYIESHAKKHKKTWKEDQRKIDKHLLPVWKNRSLQSITKNDVILMHTNIGKNARYEANRAVNLLATMFSFAKEWGYVDDNFSNPTQYVKLFKEEKRDRWVTHEELPKLVEAIDKEQNLYARVAIWLYLLTGMRKSELLGAKWEDIDFSRNEIRLSQTKAGRVHYIPLSEAALKFLHNIPRLEDNPYILPGHVKGKHLVNISKPWNRIRSAAGLKDVRLHDLRRTVGSWLAQAGNSLHLIGRVLNHSNQSTTAIYARFAQDHVREALENHGKLLLNAARKDNK